MSSFIVSPESILRILRIGNKKFTLNLPFNEAFVAKCH